MVRLDDGWLAIVEQLVEMDIEERTPELSIGSDGVSRVRSALLARVDSTIEQEIAALLERIVTKELRALTDERLLDIAGGSVRSSPDPVELDDNQGPSRFDEDEWPSFEDDRS